MKRLQPVTDARQLRRAFGMFPSGVAAICARIDRSPVGMAASSFTSVSVEPALVSVNLQNTSETWKLLRDRPRLGLSVLAASHEVAVMQLASKTGDRFAGIEWDAGPHDCILIRGSSAWMEVSLYEEVPAGDHSIALLEVHGLDTSEHTPPLIFHASKFHKMPNATELEDDIFSGRG